MNFPFPIILGQGGGGGGGRRSYHRSGYKKNYWKAKYYKHKKAASKRSRTLAVRSDPVKACNYLKAMAAKAYKHAVPQANRANPDNLHAAKICLLEGANLASKGMSVSWSGGSIGSTTGGTATTGTSGTSGTTMA